MRIPYIIKEFRPQVVVSSMFLMCTPTLGEDSQFGGWDHQLGRIASLDIQTAVYPRRFVGKGNLCWPWSWWYRGIPNFRWKSFKKIDIVRVFFRSLHALWLVQVMFLELCVYIFRLHKHMVCNGVNLKFLDGYLPTPCSCTGQHIKV